MKTFGERLKYARRAKNITQKDLAEKCGVKASVFGHYEHDRNGPTMEVLKKICTELEISADWLLGLCDDEKHVKSAEVKFTTREQAIRDIILYCEENNVIGFNDLMFYCIKNEYDWYKHLCEKDTFEIVTEYLRSRNSK